MSFNATLQNTVACTAQAKTDLVSGTLVDVPDLKEGQPIAQRDPSLTILPPYEASSEITPHDYVRANLPALTRYLADYFLICYISAKDPDKHKFLDWDQKVRGDNSSWLCKMPVWQHDYSNINSPLRKEYRNYVRSQAITMMLLQELRGKPYTARKQPNGRKWNMPWRKIFGLGTPTENLMTPNDGVWIYLLDLVVQLTEDEEEKKVLAFMRGHLPSSHAFEYRSCSLEFKKEGTDIFDSRDHQILTSLHKPYKYLVAAKSLSEPRIEEVTKVASGGPLSIELEEEESEWTIVEEDLGVVTF